MGMFLSSNVFSSFLWESTKEADNAVGRKLKWSPMCLILNLEVSLTITVM